MNFLIFRSGDYNIYEPLDMELTTDKSRKRRLETENPKKDFEKIKRTATVTFQLIPDIQQGDFKPVLMHTRICGQLSFETPLNHSSLILKVSFFRQFDGLVNLMIERVQGKEEEHTNSLKAFGVQAEEKWRFLNLYSGNQEERQRLQEIYLSTIQSHLPEKYRNFLDRVIIQQNCTMPPVFRQDVRRVDDQLIQNYHQNHLNANFG